MEKMNMSKDLLARRLREALKDVHDREIRQKIVARLKEHLTLLERLQTMPYEQRAAFWHCNYHLFDYLRINGQVQREAGEFGSDVKENVKEILKELHHDRYQCYRTLR